MARSVQGWHARGSKELLAQSKSWPLLLEGSQLPEGGATLGILRPYKVWQTSVVQSDWHLV